MFTSQLSLHYTGSTNTTEMIKDEPHAVTHVKLVLDSLTPQIAKQISREFHDTFFTKDGQIHDHVTSVNVRLREPQQAIGFRGAADMPPQVEMRNVRIPRVTVTKRGEEKDEEAPRKSRKVAPTQATLRATLHCLMLPETRQAREFLCRMPGKTFLVDFGNEHTQLDFGPDPDEDDDDAVDEEQPDLAMNDDDTPHRLTNQVVAAALEQVDIELKPEQLSAMTNEQRQIVVDWVEAYQYARERNMSPLPTPPDFVSNPLLLVPPAPDPEAGDVLDDQKVVDIAKKRKPRAGKFDTSIGAQVKAKKGKK